VLRSRATRGNATVLTPHPLEAARLLGSDTAAIQAGRLGAAQAIADRFGTTVVLKGSGTVIAAPATTPAINSTGSAALATGGTGDVLAGWIAGL
jgi:ADP-dependent NAD(P)H-hydrate dehydratase / NAD(P)H-hydrate epimerase